MALFQNSVLRKHLDNIDKNPIMIAYENYQKVFLSKIENIMTSKEEQYQYGFLDDLFVKVLGYTLNPSPDFNLTTEFKNLSDSKKADGAIMIDGKVLAVIELKSTKTKSMDSIVNQAFNYKNNHPTCRYIITSNFQKLRLYIDHSDSYEEFDLFGMDFERFMLFYYLLNKDNLFANIPIKLKEQSKLKEQDISNELYKKYSGLRANLFENIVKNNHDIDKLTLLAKTQTLLDRMVFIFFAEDRGILPTNTIATIIEHYKNDIEDRALFHFYKIYFKAINEGNPKINITEYNGGLFAEDELLNALIIDDEVLDACPLALSAYDFNTDIDVNILGHIFENSLSDIEEMKADIENQAFDKTKTKRKKDGVFYTPEYITKYIVDNTLGKLCVDKKEALGLENIEISIPKNPKKLNKGETKLKDALESYRQFLLNLKILMGGNVLGLYDVKKGILENNLYGVDINSEAVEIAKLSLWLRTVEHGRKLNILSGKIKVGNSLIDEKKVADDAFVWEEEFKEVFEQGGFDCVIGNPPYVRQELLTSEMKNYFKTKYTTYHGSADLYVFFIERGFNLLRQSGKFSFIFPNKWLKANYGKPLRTWLQAKHLDEIVDFGDLQIFHDATTYPMIMTLSDEEKDDRFDFMKLETLDFGDLGKYVKSHSSQIILKNLADDGWQLVSKEVQKILDITKQDSITLGEYTNGEILYGIKTGLTEAFVIDEETKNALIEQDASSKEILKPFLMGKDIQRYDTPNINKYLVLFPKGFTKEQSNLEDEDEAWRWIQSRYPAIYGWLEQFEAKGKKRYDKGDFWWELRACEYYEAFEKPKIIYLVFQVKPAFIIDTEKAYSNNAAFVYPKEDYFLLGILNSKLGWFLISNSCTQIQNGYQLIYDYFKNIPIPLNPNFDKKEKLEKMAKEVVSLNQALKTKTGKFLKRLQSNFEIDKFSRKLEAFYESDFKTFLKELKKKKVTLTLVEQDEWEEYFESYQEELLEIKVEIDATDKEIDEMVYGLYGLSEEEVAVVDSSVK